jgi:hypothetical protein
MVDDNVVENLKDQNSRLKAAAAQAYGVLGTVIVQADPETAAQIEPSHRRPAAHLEGTRRPYLRRGGATRVPCDSAT